MKTTEKLWQEALAEAKALWPPLLAEFACALLKARAEAMREAAGLRCPLCAEGVPYTPFWQHVIENHLGRVRVCMAGDIPERAAEYERAAEAAR